MKIVLQIVFVLLAFPGVAFSQLFVYQIENTANKESAYLAFISLDVDSSVVLQLMPQPDGVVLAKQISLQTKSKEGKTLTIHHADKTVELIEYQESLEALELNTCTHGRRIHKMKLTLLYACKKSHVDKKGNKFILLEEKLFEKGAKKESLKTFHDPNLFSRIHRKELTLFEKGKKYYQEVHLLVDEQGNPVQPEDTTPPRRPSYDKAVV